MLQAAIKNATFYGISSWKSWRSIPALHANTNRSWASLHATKWEHSRVSKSKAKGDRHKNAKQTTCTAVHTFHDPAGAYFTAATMALPHLFFFFTQVLLKHYSIDAAPTAHAYDTHSYRFVVFQILLVAFHAQICQPSSNWRRLCFWSHCLQVSRKHTRQYRGKLDKLCAVYANQSQNYCILPYLCSNCIFTTCGDKFSKHNIHLCCS